MALLKVLMLIRQVHQKSIGTIGTSGTIGTILCYYWYFLDEEFNFQPGFFSGCHDELITSMNLSNIDILNVHGIGYGCIINGISKRETTGLSKNANYKT